MNAAAVHCPYCRTPVLEGADPPSVLCPGCGTPHHADCFEENGGCTIFGCSAAPPDEPKLSIAASEAHSANSSVSSHPIATELDPNEPPPPPALLFGAPALPQPKSRTTYILLGVLLGCFGAHSFYAGYRQRGALQLILTLLTVGIAGLGIWVWAIIDVCTVSQDSKGVHFRD